MLANVVAISFVLLLSVGVPALSYSTAHSSQLRLVPRISLYFSAAASQWILSLTGLLAAFVALPSFSAAGFRVVSFLAATYWTGILTVIALASLGVFLALEHWGLWPPEPELVHMLIPETRIEKVLAVCVVATTAGLCEEFLYRGFLLYELLRWFHSASLAWVASSVAFALAHFYQGWSGALRAGALGALLAWPVVRLGTIYPSMAAHFLIDALALVWLGPKFLKMGDEKLN